MTTDDLLGEREPVRVQSRRAGEGGAGTGKRVRAAEQLARRLAGLPAGRYELIVSVGADGVLADWSVRFFGKVESPGAAGE